MYRQLINLIASKPYDTLTPYRVMGKTAFYFLKLEPALPISDYVSIEGVCVDVKGDTDRIMALADTGIWDVLNQRSDADIIALLYNRLRVNQLQITSQWY